MTRYTLPQYIGNNFPSIQEVVDNICAWKEGDLAIGEDIYKNEYSMLVENPAIMTLCRMGRIFGERSCKFYTHLSKHLRNPYIFSSGELPLINTILDVEKDKDGNITSSNFYVLVYDNAKVVKAIHQDFISFSWFNDPYNTLPNMLKRMASESSQKWSPSTRAISQVKRATKMRLGKFINTYVPSHGLSDANLQKAITYIEEEYAPVVVKTCKTPEEIMEVYNGGPSSCMVNNGARSWGSVKEFHPTMFYYYYPHSECVYISRGGKATARTIVYPKEKHFARVYSNNQEDHKRLLEYLNNNGYTNGKEVYLAAEFEIPGFVSSHGSVKDFACPAPYFDNICGNNLNISFDKERSVFVFRPAKNDAEKNFRASSSGIMWASELNNVACSCCGAIKLSNKMHQASDGNYYCSSKCLSRSGFTAAVRGDGAIEYIPKREAYIDPLCGESFTTARSCRDRGGNPVLTAHYAPEVEDDENYSIGGNMVVYKDKYYQMSGDDYQLLSRHKLVYNYRVKGLLNTTGPVSTHINTHKALKIIRSKNSKLEVA